MNATRILNARNHLRSMKRGKGFTLIEMMLVIAAAVALLGIGLVIYTQVQSSSAGLAGSSALLQVSSGVKQLYHAPTYTGLNAKTMIDAKKVPSSLITGTPPNQTLVNGWGGAITLAAASYGGGTDNAYAITFTLVPTDSCNDLVAAVRENFRVIRVGTNVVKDESAGTNATVPQVTGYCAGGTKTLEFTGT